MKIKIAASFSDVFFAFEVYTSNTPQKARQGERKHQVLKFATTVKLNTLKKIAQNRNGLVSWNEFLHYNFS